MAQWAGTAETARGNRTRHGRGRVVPDLQDETAARRGATDRHQPSPPLTDNSTSTAAGAVSRNGTRSVRRGRGRPSGRLASWALAVARGLVPMRRGGEQLGDPGHRCHRLAVPERENVPRRWSRPRRRAGRQRSLGSQTRTAPRAVRRDRRRRGGSRARGRDRRGTRARRLRRCQPRAARAVCSRATRTAGRRPARSRFQPRGRVRGSRRC
jgi:hypothetical protein